MTSNASTNSNSKQTKPIQLTINKSSSSTATAATGTGFEFPFSPTEPGKFDFYRVHRNNQDHRTQSTFTNQPVSIASNNMMQLLRSSTNNASKVSSKDLNHLSPQSM